MGGRKFASWRGALCIYIQDSRTALINPSLKGDCMNESQPKAKRKVGWKIKTAIIIGAFIVFVAVLAKMSPPVENTNTEMKNNNVKIATNTTNTSSGNSNSSTAQNTNTSPAPQVNTNS